MDQLDEDMSEQTESESTRPTEEWGAPWGAPGGAIRRWLQRRFGSKQNGSSPDSE